jgi:hypothetical protein
MIIGVTLGVLLVVGLPLAGKWWRGPADSRCVWDGLKIDPLYRVRVVTASGESKSLCCVRCAAKWLDRQANQPAAIFVTDEASGAEVDHRRAFFVQSPVTTNPITGNRVHVFRARADADAHVRTFGGEVLEPADGPLPLLP